LVRLNESVDLFWIHFVFLCVDSCVWPMQPSQL
jgi:hypothetical protein